MAPTAPLDTLNKVIGAMMVGTFANSMLYMLELLQVIKYFRAFPKDSNALKTIVVLLFILDSTCTFAEWACIYLYGVLHWGDLEYLGYQNLVIPIYIYTSGLIGFIVQNFLISRYYKLTKRKIACACLFLMTLAALVGAIWCATELCIFTAYALRNVAVKSAILWIVSSAATDIAIAAALVLQLNTVKSSFRETRSLIRRLIFHTIQTGSFTTAVAICVLATYLTDTNANICVGFGFMLGRIYTLTMLFNLNNRAALGAGGELLSGSGRHMNAPNNDGISLHGITVHRTAIVHIDDGDEAPSRSQHEMDDKRATRDYGPFGSYNPKAPSDGTLVEEK
ncbi:hypothetical protein C8R46DRAFT_1272078 [Mycena filopes]|nr:hypothetical protein C8R46DRAFT_1272078 [Mycena filopes]